MSYTKLLNDMTWSFSRLHAYEQCAYSFYLKYIEKREGDSNFYAANGKCMHEVFEALLSGRIKMDECPQYYLENYDLIYETEKQSTMDSTFDKCIDYLCEMDDFDEDKYEVIGVELRMNFKINKYNMTGFADLVVKDRETGEFILVDHKQATHFMKKDGTPLKNQQDNFFAYKKQMYIYCIGLKEQFGICVDKIVWHHFKDNGAVTVIDYKEEECEETKKWVVDTIAKIKKDKTFGDNQSYLMCKALCDYRDSCEYKLMEGDDNE